jgi:hypothetical protein
MAFLKAAKGAIARCGDTLRNVVLLPGENNVHIADLAAGFNAFSASSLAARVARLAFGRCVR